MRRRERQTQNEGQVGIPSGSEPGPINIKRLSVILVAGYVLLTVLLYFLMGEQLHLRDSRGNLEMPAATAGTLELTAGSSVEELFSANIHRLQGISIQWGTYYRANSGNILIELYNQQDGSLLLSQTLDAAEITEGQVSTVTAETPLEGLANVPLRLRISSPDSVPGSAVSPMMSTDPAAAGEGTQLFLNGVPTPGTLCFSAYGQDYIWTGLHYWKLAAVGGALLLAYLGFTNYRARKGKKSLLLYAIAAVRKYRFLIRQLVGRDFKAKYKRSVLGVLWSFLNPLFMMIVQYFVFSTIFKSDIPNYPVYLLSGIVLFNFFTECCSMTLSSIIGNASLITKVYVPKYVYPLSRTMSSSINLGISLIPLFLVILFTGTPITPSTFLFVIALMMLIIFTFGLGMMLTSSMVFFRDTQFLWNVVSMIWMYATPLFYPESILPREFAFVLKINPLYYFVKFSRICLIDGISPEPMLYVQCGLFALASLLIGTFIFKKTQDKFILYI